MPDEPFSLGLYRRLVKVYPAGFRENYAQLLEREFRNELNEPTGAVSLGILWIRLIWDLAISVPLQFSREVAQDAGHTFRLWEATPQASLERLLELERVRSRIARDLHDDIGSSLSQIAIMSEVERRDGTAERGVESLKRITDLSRELMDSMNDIVWAINPRRDHLSDLAQRMRRFASDMLTATNVEITFQVSSERADVSLYADVRREVFLIFKESVNNVARHSGCDHVSVVLSFQGLKLLMKICDDGQGFRADQVCNGLGHDLASMGERARRLGGQLDIVSEVGRGTCVTLTVPRGSTRTSKIQTTFPRRPSGLKHGLVPRVGEGQLHSTSSE
jgi:signal transduction histidine kinase